MSDDVRARAEAVALAYKNLRESISRWHGDGFAVSVNLGPLYESCDSLTAALAVAPATAQPVAWVVMGNRGTRRSPPYLSLEAAERCAVELDRGEFLEDIAETPHRVVPLYAAPPATGDAAAVRPEVVCLCGSTRFIDTFAEQYGRLTDEGKIVLTVGRVVPQSEQALGSPRKAALDVLHLRKIDLADRVLVLNVGGYVGPSTRREIAYAKERGKPIDLLYPDAGLDGAAPALPLPAPATAVEEARKAFYEAARAMMHAKRTEAAEADWDDALAAAVVKTTKAASRAYYDVLNAEAADEGHTLAAKESRSDDRPEAGKGGV